MNHLVDSFISHVNRCRGLSVEQKEDNGHVIVFVKGKKGNANVDFAEEEITGEINTNDIHHIWGMFPNTFDMKYGAKKIANVLG